MDAESVFKLYQELQTYVGWTDEDARRVQAIAALVDPHLSGLIDDFYEVIIQHEGTRKVITGGAAQIERLKQTLRAWLRELFIGKYDADYVIRRWRVGMRHVDIGLDQVYTNAAMSRIRGGLLRILENHWTGDPLEGMKTRRSLSTLLDLDLALIEAAYQSEYQLRQQRTERLAAIGQVAGGIAHELRNPLNVVRTSVYYLLNARNPKPEKQAEHLRRIEQQVLLADSVITALSRFAKLPVPEMRPFRIDTCLRELLEIAPLPETIKVEVDIADGSLLALADQEQIQIVFNNLIRNAKEAMPNGGTLRIVAKQVDHQVQISIVDTGVGIAHDQLHRIMEPLYSTKARGLGLGLAMARSILEKNDGSLHVESEVGKGSTFTVWLQSAGNEGTTESS